MDQKINLQVLYFRMQNLLYRNSLLYFELNNYRYFDIFSDTPYNLYRN